MSAAHSSFGILGACRTLALGLLASLRDRAQLVSLELHEEKLRLIQMFNSPSQHFSQ